MICIAFQNKAKARHVRGHGLHNTLSIQRLCIIVELCPKSRTQTSDFRMRGVYKGDNAIPFDPEFAEKSKNIHTLLVSG